MIDDGAPRLRRDQLFGTEPVRSGPAAGEPFPPFDLATTDGPRIRNRDLAGRPALIALASCTCPIAAHAGPLLRWLHGAYGDRVSFLAVYVREARPSRRYMQPTTFEQKFAFANDYRRRHGIPWTVAVDDVEGTLQRALGGRPSPAYLLDRSGRIVRSVPESSDLSELRRGLDEVLCPVRPMIRGAPEPAPQPPASGSSAPEVDSRPVAARAELPAPAARTSGRGDATASAAILVAGVVALVAGGIAWLLLDPDR